ncbi:P-loop containing nucleoside triphosphate hydrolase protein [Xylaria acuta]|nr:P-loop containing nucleoside triphosphate hydrolase protein [Xylaria acuta]
MSQIDKHLAEFRNTQQPSRLVLYGTGGSGKTQLALHYCRHSSGTFSGVFWIDGTSTATIYGTFVTAAKEFILGDLQSQDTEQAKAIVLRFIGCSDHPWLVVFDNCDDVFAYEIEDFLPKQGRNFTIITSRDRATQSLGPMVSIGNLTIDEALQLLFRKRFDEQNTQAIQKGRVVVERLGYLPLAIAQASAYIRGRNVLDLDIFLEKYDVEQRRISATIPIIWGYGRE